MFKIKNAEKRSPIKAAPLRSAGQSLEEEIRNIQAVEIGTYLSVGFCFLFLAIFEWFKWLRNWPPQPVTISIAAIIIIAYCTYKIFRYRKIAKRLKMAKDGEKAVGEFLERFRENGYRIFHDIVGGDFNIDHVLIGPSGIYTIETKTVSKFLRGVQKIKYDGKSISINGSFPNEKPIIQAKAQANWLGQLIKDLTGEVIPIKPIVVYPGWYIDGSGSADVWVLEPKALSGFLNKRPNMLKQMKISAISNYLSRYVRNSTKGNL